METHGRQLDAIGAVADSWYPSRGKIDMAHAIQSRRFVNNPIDPAAPPSSLGNSISNAVSQAYNALNTARVIERQLHGDRPSTLGDNSGQGAETAAVPPLSDRVLDLNGVLDQLNSTLSRINERL